MGTRNSILIVSLAAAMATAGFQGAGDGFQRERGRASDALKNALEGKAPPPVQATEWLNTDMKKLDWKAMAGKVVLLDFWAHW